MICLSLSLLSLTLTLSLSLSLPLCDNGNDNGNQPASMGLTKIQGYLEKKSSSGLRRWQKRWFEVKPDYFAYFKNNQKTALLCAMDITHVLDVQVHVTEGGDDMDAMRFVLRLSDGREMHLRVVESTEQTTAANWIASFTSILAAKQTMQGRVVVPSSQNAPLKWSSDVAVAQMVGGRAL